MTLRKAYLPLLLVIAANLWIAAGVFWNRSGAPTGELTFDDCAFGRAGGHSVGSDGRSLSLYVTSPPITTTGEAGDKRHRRTRPAYLLIEEGGAAWEAYLAGEAERRAKNPDYTPFIPQSRLLFSDSATAAGGLKSPQAGNTGAAIVRGYVTSYRSDEGTVQHRYAGRPQIAIPSEYRAAFRAIHAARFPAGREEGEASCTSEYRITLRFGARFEPWIAGIEPL